MKIPPVAERISTGEGSSTNFTKYLLEKSCKDCFRYSPRDFFFGNYSHFSEIPCIFIQKNFQTFLYKIAQRILKIFSEKSGKSTEIYFRKFFNNVFETFLDYFRRGFQELLLEFLKEYFSNFFMNFFQKMAMDCTRNSAWFFLEIISAISFGIFSENCLKIPLQNSPNVPLQKLSWIPSEFSLLKFLKYMFPGFR